MPIAAGLRTSGRAAKMWPVVYWMPLPNREHSRISANGIVRSQLPLRGSSGFEPDSILGLVVVLDTATGHKIWGLVGKVNDL
jgi:hypothetical protein